MKMNIISIFLLLFTYNLFAEDLEQGVSGGEVKDMLAPKPGEVRNSPFAFENGKNGRYLGEETKSSEGNFAVETKPPTDLVVKDLDSKKLKDSGYTLPGTFEKDQNYLELDKEQFAKDFRHKSTSALNIAYFRDSFNYQSTNDIVARTIGEGYKHVKAGMIQVRADQYIYKSFALNVFWAAGGGISYNSGRGSFVTGTKSDTTLTFWELPADLGIGLEIPLYNWIKFSGVAGPSGMVLAQSRNDFENGEKGKNKFQFSYGQFASAQFKINLSGFSDNLAYDLFTSSQITNLSVNFEARYENYKNFQDSSLAISGTSFGLGFTFEFL